MNTIHWMRKAKPKGKRKGMLVMEIIAVLISYGFFEFENEQMAQEAVKQTDGYRLDKNHTFSVSLMGDFDR